MWLFVTPVIYPGTRVTAKLAGLGIPGWVYGLNPMAGVVEGFRWALFRRTGCPYELLVSSTLSAAAILISGAFYFRRTERIFADVV
jgi:lipopolysaccharide transport system permease protein